MNNLALEIIQSSSSYSDAYYRMIDAGIVSEEASVYWDTYKDQCGLMDFEVEGPGSCDLCSNNFLSHEILFCPDCDLDED